ncbi:allantoate permease [[Candida] jaroonii]|uniref:Allantoate permease n=1 Tax=[Candida] jaroonii TaxID=467808 RepID=A0ACA9Y1M7_9ASCO|nr:allantoate permease [[Candida] jaroonii]
MSSIESEKNKNAHVTTVVSVPELNEKLAGNNVDKAFAFKDDIQDVEIDPVLERKMKRKIDWVLLPMIALLMSLQLLDKTCNSYASIMGLLDDLNIPTTGVSAAEASHNAKMYSEIGSSFYWGYLISAFISGRILQKLPIATTLSAIIFVWGIVVGCHAACKTAPQFIGCRVLLGVLEGFLNPGYTTIISMFYRKGNTEGDKAKRVPEQYMRTQIFFGLQGCGTLLGAGVAHGLYTHTNHTALASWRLLYLICGAITVSAGIVSYFYFPNIPAKAWFLNDTERKYSVIRSKENQQGFGNTKFKKYQAIEAFKDIRSYCLFIYAMSYGIANGSFNNFGSILLKGDFGFSTSGALLMNMPGGSIDIVVPILAYALCWTFKSRYLAAICTNTFSTIGMVCLAFAPTKGGRLFGYLTFYVATLVYATSLSVIASNVAGSTKKTVVWCFLLAGYSVGNLTGPYTFKVSEAPGYHSAKISLLVAFIVGTLCFVTIYLHDTIENKRRDKYKEQMGEAYEVLEDFEFADLTDKENKEFRYSY